MGGVGRGVCVGGGECVWGGYECGEGCMWGIFELCLSVCYDRYNKLTELPASLCNCTALTEISLESNNLSTLPVSSTVTMATSNGGNILINAHHIKCKIQAFTEIQSHYLFCV